MKDSGLSLDGFHCIFQVMGADIRGFPNVSV